MKLIFTGLPPSKKNGKMMIFGNGSPRLISSKQYSEWEEAQAWLYGWRKKLPPPPYKITYLFKIADNRKFDLSNKIESIQDCLVKYQILPDDNWSVIAEFSVSWEKSTAPMVEVVISEFPIKTT